VRAAAPADPDKPPGGLYPVSAATVVDATGVDVVTTDGPFAESKEHLGGFWIVQADDLDGAL
jgi:hypothetical protein